MEQEGDGEASGSGSTSDESYNEKDDKGKVKKLDIIGFIVFHIIIVKDELLVMVQLKE